MNFNQLSESEKKVVVECVNAVVYGPFIPTDLFHTLMGVERNAFINFANNWNGVNIKTEKEDNNIYMALLQLLEYPHGQEHVWSDYISQSINFVAEIFYKLTGVNIKEKEKWDGIIKGYLTAEAQKLWDKIDKKKRAHILTNVWCHHCNNATTITNYEGGVDSLNRISIYGKCVVCFNHVSIEVTV